MRHPFRRKNLSLRLLPLYAAAVVVVGLANPTTPGLVAGLALVGVGLALRAWGAGHLVKNERLTVSGPYAYIRHPLYAGTLLLVLGIGAIAGGAGFIWVVVALAPLFFGYYLPYKERIESARLERRYGGDYASYRAEVPLLLPTRGAWQPPVGLSVEAARRWNGGCFRENDEAGTLLGVALAVALLALRPLLIP